jgi:hypothetical protein
VTQTRSVTTHDASAAASIAVDNPATAEVIGHVPDMPTYRTCRQNRSRLNEPGTPNPGGRGWMRVPGRRSSDYDDPWRRIGNAGSPWQPA